MFAVLLIAATEHIFKEWQNDGNRQLLEIYFSDTCHGRKATNGEKIRNLCDAFGRTGAPVEPDIFEDYLAIKYLRNTIVHARWKPAEQAHVEARGFPTDSRDLTEGHWQRMHEVKSELMTYIAGSRAMKSKNRSPT